MRRFLCKLEKMGANSPPRRWKRTPSQMAGSTLLVAVFANMGMSHSVVAAKRKLPTRRVAHARAALSKVPTSPFLPLRSVKDCGETFRSPTDRNRASNR